MQDLLLTVIIGMLALVLALLGRRLLGGKASHVYISAMTLLVLLAFSLYQIRTPLALNYYGLLSTEALFGFAFPMCCLIAACSSWMEWLSPPPQWKTRTYRANSIFDGVLLTFASIGFVVLFLPKVAAIIPDMVTGPSFEEGTVEQLTLRQGRGLVSGGEFVVHGVSYFTANLPWYNTLSVGQSTRFAYSPKSLYGFPADRIILTPMGITFPVLVVGSILLVFGAGYHVLKPPDKPTDKIGAEERNPFEQFTNGVVRYRQTKGTGPFILLMILPLLFLGLVLLFFVLK